jgi:hypothetical protein
VFGERDRVVLRSSASDGCIVRYMVASSVVPSLSYMQWTAGGFELIVAGRAARVPSRRSVQR